MVFSSAARPPFAISALVSARSHDRLLSINTLGFYAPNPHPSPLPALIGEKRATTELPGFYAPRNAVSLVTLLRPDVLPARNTLQTPRAIGKEAMGDAIVFDKYRGGETDIL